MKILRLKHLIFVFFALFSMAFGSERIEFKTTGVGGKLFCVKPGKTYCENVVDYPREQLEKLLSDKYVYNVDI